MTTIFDHHASFGEIPGSLFAIQDVCRELGMRACLCYEVSWTGMGKEKCVEAIRENADFARWAREQDDDMIRAMFGGHALFTLSDRTFAHMVEANSGMTGFHIHVAEGMNDVYDSLRNYGCRPVNRLLNHGILGEKTILGHCIHINPPRWRSFGETGTMVVNNPGQYGGNAVGCSPVLQMMEQGILVVWAPTPIPTTWGSLKLFLLIQRQTLVCPT